MRGIGHEILATLTLDKDAELVCIAWTGTHDRAGRLVRTTADEAAAQRAVRDRRAMLGQQGLQRLCGNRAGFVRAAEAQ